jgi:prepilin-type N-terminal cleavage/methylation domain-containing protein
MRPNAGLTLMELTIVLAILAIIAAILIPAFLNTTDRARLRSDIQSARVIHNAMELYRAERGQAVPGANMDAILTNLRTAGYIEERHYGIQTKDAVWQVDTQRGVVVNIAASADGVHRAFNGLSDEERAYVAGGRATDMSPANAR